MNFQELIEHKATSLTKSKGEHLFKQGEKDASLYFLESGLLKSYYLSEDGKESVKSFLQTGDIIGSLLRFSLPI